jgi:glutamate-1-semialdehyde 2,1-aminomutase
VVAIVQARLGSVRLPGKVLEDLAGMPALELLLGRLSGAATIDESVLAVPEGAASQPLLDLAARLGVRCVQGSETDVLDRYLTAARASAATVVVRITGDCPLIDPAVVDRVAAPVIAGEADCAATGSSFPDGLDVQVTTIAALEQAALSATDPYDREHVFPAILRDERLKGQKFEHHRDLAGMRLTLDEAADLDVLRGVLSAVDHREIVFCATPRISANWTWVNLPRYAARIAAPRW